jgi:regulator of protease activity HflC (stomatin/prohibitin superfamily)
MIEIIIILIIALLVFRPVKVIQQYEIGLLFELGKYAGKLGPGVHIVMPLIQKVQQVDIREKLIDVPAQEVITKDNGTVVVDGVVYYKIVDAEKAILNIYDYEEAISQLAQTYLRATIGKLELDELLSAREKLNAELRDRLDSETDAWGIKITKLEIKKIDPPKSIQQAMAQQLTAEREKRARLTAAEAEKQEQITKAEGYKQSNILRAEADAKVLEIDVMAKSQAKIRDAEAEARKIELLAEAEAKKIKLITEAEIERVNKLSKYINDDYLKYLYIENLPKLSSNSKSIVVPYEALNITTLAEIFKNKE